MFFRFLTYNKFKENKWKRLNPKKRLRAFQKLENIQAKKLGRPACKVIARTWEENPNMNGQFSSGNNTIELNTKFIMENNMRFFGMATLFHEGRHAYQNYLCYGGKKVRRFSKAYKWKKNFQGYVNGENDKYSFYSMQPIERDANKYAIIRLKNFRHRFRKDKIFKATLERKIEEFADVKDLAKKELGMFYKLRVALRNRKERRR